jgi:carboxyl-terminal processing protease
MQRLKLIAIGAIAGSALVVLAHKPGLAPLIAGAEASSSTEAAENYRQLELFGQVYDIVRRDYVDKPDDKPDRISDQRHGEWARPAFGLYGFE